MQYTVNVNVSKLQYVLQLIQKNTWKYAMDYGAAVASLNVKKGWLPFIISIGLSPLSDITVLSFIILLYFVF